MTEEFKHKYKHINITTNVYKNINITTNVTYEVVYCSFEQVLMIFPFTFNSGVIVSGVGPILRFSFHLQFQYWARLYLAMVHLFSIFIQIS